MNNDPNDGHLDSPGYDPKEDCFDRVMAEIYAGDHDGEIPNAICVDTSDLTRCAMLFLYGDLCVNTGHQSRDLTAQIKAYAESVVKQRME